MSMGLMLQPDAADMPELLDALKRSAEVLRGAELMRSEERRVGKVGRSRWSPDH